MIRSFTVEGFRGFERFELRGLGRINLLVGANNSGKTSLLEALELFGGGGSSADLWRILQRRGEATSTDAVLRAQVAHLFFGHTPRVGSAIRLKATGESLGAPYLQLFPDQSEERVLSVEIVRDEVPDGPDEWYISGPEWRLPLTVGLEAIPPRGLAFDPDAPPVVFIGSRSVDPSRLSDLLGEVLLTPEEGLLTEALRTIEPGFERIATVPTGRSGRTGIVVKLRDVPKRVPIGNLGDGLWRLAAIALSLIAARGGLLLIDEIDTGLHHSVMDQMWRLVQASAKRLDVQVFATTHSRECYESLAIICSDEPHDEVSIQRIEARSSRAVAFTEPQIRIAAERGIEVR